MTLTVTIVIIALTALISFNALYNQKIEDDLIFHPPTVTNQNQWYRFFSCGLIHADIPHLAFNMLSLFMFGSSVEGTFAYIFGKQAPIFFLVLYISALAVSILPTYFKHKNDYYYKSLGASGAVSAVVFASIFLNPTGGVGSLLINLSIPGFIYAILFLVGSNYLAKKGGDNINHSAHIWGSIYGVVFLIAACYLFSDFDPIYNFTESIKIWAKKLLPF